MSNLMNRLQLKKNQKGFTLMEMLIVVAIIAVLVAILIPTMSGQLQKAKESTDVANLRAAYAELQAYYLENGKLPDSGEKTTAGTYESYEPEITAYSGSDTSNYKWPERSSDDKSGTDGMYKATKNKQTYTFSFGDGGEFKATPIT